MILTQRLCVFFHLEVTAYLSNQAVRTEAYAIQDENLEIQHYADYNDWLCEGCPDADYLIFPEDRQRT